MLYKLIRFTPTRSLTYNNRWNPNVRPKGTLFFIPAERSQVHPWIDFLCTKHHRTFLYIHTIVIRATRSKTRVLTTWKGVPLLEVMIRERDYVKRVRFRTQRVMKGIKSIPQVVRWFIR